MRARRAARLVVGVAAVAVGLVVAVRAFSVIPVDLLVYRDGGRAVLDADPLYGGPLAHGLPFTYPPWAAILFTSLAVLTPAAAKLVMIVGNCAAAVLAASTARNALAGASDRALVLAVAGAAFATEAVRTTVYLGQINLLLLAVILWDLLRADDRRTKGIGLGIVAGIKLTPLFFVLYLVATRRVRAAGVAVGAFLATVAVGFVLLPADSARFWLAGTFVDAGRVFPDPGAPQNQSLHGLVLRLGGSTTLWLSLAVPVIACTVAVAVRASRRGAELLALTLCGLCATTVCPWSWGHHWVWLLPLGVFLAVSAPRRPRHAGWLGPAGLMVLTVPPVLTLAVPPPGDPPAIDAGPVAFLLGNVYLLVFASTVLAAVVHLAHLEPRRGGRRRHVHGFPPLTPRRPVAGTAAPPRARHG